MQDPAVRAQEPSGAHVPAARDPDRHLRAPGADYLAAFPEALPGISFARSTIETRRPFHAAPRVRGATLK